MHAEKNYTLRPRYLSPTQLDRTKHIALHQITYILSLDFLDYNPQFSIVPLVIQIKYGLEPIFNNNYYDKIVY